MSAGHIVAVVFGAIGLTFLLCLGGYLCYHRRQPRVTNTVAPTPLSGNDDGDSGNRATGKTLPPGGRDSGRADEPYPPAYPAHSGTAEPPAYPPVDPASHANGEPPCYWPPPGPMIPDRAGPNLERVKRSISRPFKRINHKSEFIARPMSESLEPDPKVTVERDSPAQKQ
jgi:hypothetical protein